MERPTVTQWLFGFAPPETEQRWSPVVEESIRAVSSSLIGNIAISIVAAIVAGLSAYILGLPFPIVLAVITGLLDLIPQIGATIAAVILVAVALTVGTTEAVIMLVIQLIYQQVENYIVYPIVYKRQVELTPFTTIVAVLIAGSLLGVVGAILAMPFAAVIKTVIREASAPRRARMEALRPRSYASKSPSDGDHSGPLTPRRPQRGDVVDAPVARGRRRCRRRARPAGREIAAGVRLKRGAGAGWSFPSTSTNVPRATLCGCCGASASAEHRGRARLLAFEQRGPLVARAGGEHLGEALLELGPARLVPLRERVGVQLQQPQQLGVELRLERADGDVPAVAASRRPRRSARRSRAGSCPASSFHMPCARMRVEHRRQQRAALDHRGVDDLALPGAARLEDRARRRRARAASRRRRSRPTRLSGTGGFSPVRPIAPSAPAIAM